MRVIRDPRGQRSNFGTRYIGDLACTGSEPDTKDEVEIKPSLIKKGLLFCLLLFADVVVGNVVYNVYIAEKDTPFLKSVKAGVLYDVWGPKKKAGGGYGVMYVLPDEAQDGQAGAQAESTNSDDGSSDGDSSE